MPSAQNKIQIVDTHEASETLAVTRLQRVGYQINRTLLIRLHVFALTPFGSRFDKVHERQLPLQSGQLAGCQFQAD
jgi:hypothetical protein